MIYFDNAASGYFKPSAAIEKAVFCMKELSVNAGRSGHAPSVSAEKLVFSTRSVLSKSFNNGPIARVILTANCTTALNFALFGLKTEKRRIVSTVTEHNSVLRPLYAMEKSGYKPVFADFSIKPYITAEDVLSLVDGETAFVVMNAVSNVTGYKNEYERVGAALKKSGVPLIVDGAQAAGHIRINMLEDGISCLTVAGHKGLLSVQGAGALIFTDDVTIEPTLFGGSGTEAFEKIPSVYPERLEAGTLNLPAIASLGVGAKYAHDNIATIGETLTDRTKYLIDGLNAIKGVRVFSDKNPFGICAFKVDGVSSVDAARIYDERFSICVRGGFHCAPLIHKALKTDDDGLIRASLSTYSTVFEINAFLNATEKIASLSDVR
ncbi:MAG: aminotransferase class V-fold PLP-dependent enzyme [Clostridia bacterium]|nr:aminotransferase class V-fold PLP-dependent enzyme [Clostridia bacterium]